MAINPNLLNIKQAKDLPVADPTSNADFLFYENETLKTSPMSNIYDKVISGVKGIAMQSNAPTPDADFERWIVSAPITAPNSWGNITVTQAELDENFVYFNVTDGVVSKELSLKPAVTKDSEIIATSSNASTSEAVFDFAKKEIATINLFNKKTLMLNKVFDGNNGEVINSNSFNALSELIPVDSGVEYGFAQKGLNSSNITAFYLAEYDEDKNFIGYSNIQSKAIVKTGASTKFLRLNPNSASANFNVWMDNFILAKIEDFPIDYVGYGDTEKPIFQSDLAFFKKVNFAEKITLTTEGVTFSNEILTITSGVKDFYNKTIFTFTSLLEYSGNTVVVTKLKGNIKLLLPLLIDQNLFYTTSDGKDTVVNYFYGNSEDEFFIVTKNNFDKNNLFVFLKEARLTVNFESAINIKIEQFILYLDDSGKPRNVDGATAEQIAQLTTQIQAVSNSVPATVNEQIATQVPAIVQQQIGSDLNAYLADHIDDFTFLQPNYIQANSGFNFSALNSAMNGKFISIIEDIDLQGATIDFVAQNVKNIKLVFNGGRILNGKIKSNYTKCIFNSNDAFVNVEILNQFQNDYAIPEWFGAKIDGIDGGIGNFTNDDSFAINQALKFASKVVLSGNRKMIIKKPIILRSGNIIEADENFEIKLGDASNCTLLKNEHVDIPHDGINPVVYPYNFKRNKNITIRGGVWNGNGLKQRRYDSDTTAFGNMPDVIGTALFPDGDTAPYFGVMMKFADIDNLLVENLTLKNGRTYMICAGGLFNYVFQNITQIRTHYIINGDGIHLHGHCYSGIIQDIKGQSGDDFVAVTTSEAGRLSIRVGDVIGLKIRNLYHYSLAVGATPSNPLEITNGIPPNTTSKRCVRLTYTDHIIDDVTIENLRQYNGDFMVLVGMSYLHHNLFSGTNGKIGNIIIKGLKDDNGTSPISVGAKTKVDHITVKDVYMKVENTVEMPAIFKQSDNFGDGDQWALTEIGTVVMDNVYVLKGNSMYASPDGLVWMAGRIKNIFINNLVVETKSGVPKFRALFSGRIDNVSITNSNVDLTEIHSTNGNATTNLTFRESNNEFNSAVIGVVPKRAITESLVVTSNPTNPKLGDKILKSDGLYLFTNAWSKL